MRRLITFILLFLCTFTTLVALPSDAQQVPSRGPTRGQGCSCPYDIDSAGRSCGGRSAYSRPGGASPVCYIESSPQATPQTPAPRIESAYERYMRIGYSASRQRDYQTALINFRRALSERPGDRYASDAITNMELAIEGSQSPSTQTSTNNFAWLSQRQVTAADLQGMSQFQLDVLRNAIYAMHGRRFERSDLQSYFNQQSWYQPRYSSNNFPSNLLSSLEQSNVQFIQNYQRNR